LGNGPKGLMILAFAAISFKEAKSASPI
jgi:hypothetical protein